MQSEDLPSTSITLQHMADWYSLFVGYQIYINASTVAEDEQIEKSTLLSLLGTISNTYLNIVSVRDTCIYTLHALVHYPPLLLKHQQQL